MQDTNLYKQQSDEQLAAGCARGDQAAFAALYERYFQAIYDFAARTVRDADTAADVVQSTFTKAWESMKKGRGGAQVRAWLYTIARNSAIDELRHRKRLVWADKAGDGGGLPAFTQVDTSRLSNAQAVLEDREMAELVWSSAAALSPKEYTLLDMHLRQGLSVDELAASLGLRKGNVYTMLSRLRDSLEESVAAAFLMRRGRRDCAALDALLNDLQATKLTRQSRRAVRDHVEQCPRCQENQRSFISPAEIFGGFALVPAAPGLQSGVWQNVSASINSAPSQAGLAQRWARLGRGVKAGIFGAIGAVVIAALAIVLLLPSGGGGSIGDPDDVRSTSHEIGEPSDVDIITITWSPHEATGYSFVFSEKPRELPDEDADLRGSATSVRSRPLDNGDWYFHMRTQGKDGSWTSTVHLGPFEIGGGAGESETTPEASPTPEDEETPTQTEVETATLAVEETATPEATPTVTPQATPSPTPGPTPTPPPTDADGDGIPDNIENAFGSDPNNAASTPEHRAYDIAFGANTCSDGLDNDQDTLPDVADPDCL